MVARDRPPRRNLLRARLGGRSGGRRSAAPRGARRLRADRPRFEGPGCGGTSLKVRAPATTANLGPGFDCAAAALDLWNEVEVGEGGDPPDPAHIGVRAFGLVASPEGLAFKWA